MKTARNYQAILSAPFGVLGICCDDEALTGIDFLPPDFLPQAPASPFAQTVCKQLAAYFANPDFSFSLPLKPNGTAHQHKVWQAMLAIPRGQTRQYGELAWELTSSPRAIGQACGANPIPIVIPCHRVVSKAGLGGFAHHRAGYELGIKRWLLSHEAANVASGGA
ncbi:MAG TPA: methylated-DNA--[protein]-cysteine S-methyltransferase [Gallionellaceae bacterium]|nr:methylated-DNA--[protein]-cysteine S-methyltransferase [Gallionellaceae bacterium]